MHVDDPLQLARGVVNVSRQPAVGVRDARQGTGVRQRPDLAAGVLDTYHLTAVIVGIRVAPWLVLDPARRSSFQFTGSARRNVPIGSVGGLAGKAVHGAIATRQVRIATPAERFDVHPIHPEHTVAVRRRAAPPGVVGQRVGRGHRAGVGHPHLYRDVSVVRV